MVAGPEEGVSGRGGRGGQSRGRGSRGRAPARHNAGNIITCITQCKKYST